MSSSQIGWGISTVIKAAFEECFQWTATIVKATIDCATDVLTLKSDIFTEAFQFCETVVEATVDCAEDFIGVVAGELGCDTGSNPPSDPGCDTGCDAPCEPSSHPAPTCDWSLDCNTW